MNHQITLEVAEKMIHAARSKAEELKIWKISRLLDASGNLKAFVRMDGAWLGVLTSPSEKLERPRYFDMTQPKSGRYHSRASLFTGSNTAMAV